MAEQGWNGKIVLVTGASRGIGQAVAEAFARRGAHVVLTARDLEKLESVRVSIQSAGGSADVLQIDVTDVAAVSAAAYEVRKRHGRVDVLVNNAGVLERRPFAETGLDSFRWHMEANFFGLVSMTKSFLPLIPAGGSIVNVSSVIGKVGMPKSSAYCASKFAVCGFSQTLRIELKPRGIHVLTYLPGLTDTDMARGADQSRMRKTDPRVVADDLIRSVEQRKAESAPTFIDRLFIRMGARWPSLIEWVVGKARG